MLNKGQHLEIDHNFLGVEEGYISPFKFSIAK